MAKTLDFYGRFSFDRSLASRLLQCIAEGQATSEEAIGSYVGVNPYKVGSDRFPRWLLHMGLVTREGKSYKLTTFGELTYRYDPTLIRESTLWLLHYYLTTNQQTYSEVWYRFANEFAAPQKTFTQEELVAFLSRTRDEIPENKSGIKGDTQELIRMYTRNQALGHLALLQKQDKSYIVQATVQPELLVIAYILLDFWARRYPRTDTLSFTILCEAPESLGRIFVRDRSEIRQWITMLSGAGYVSFAESQHEPVNRLFPDSPQQLLEKYYSQ